MTSSLPTPRRTLGPPAPPISDVTIRPAMVGGGALLPQRRQATPATPRALHLALVVGCQAGGGGSSSDCRG